MLPARARPALRRLGAAAGRMARAPPPPRKRAMAAIGTHSGTFHADEALGCFLLQHTAAFADAGVVRTRDPAVLKELDVVLDVGAEYSPGTQRYDHHQRGFNEVFGHGFATKLSSAGLIYKHYGREVVAKLMEKADVDADVECVYLAVYKNFMEAIDAVDNGINQWEGNNPPKYRNNTHLSARVGNLNPRWNEPQDDEDLYKRFLRAVELTGREFTECVDYHAKAWLPGRAPVRAAIKARHAVDDSGRIILLEAFCPWKDHLYELEAELGDDREHKWRIQAVAAAQGSFHSRQPLPKAWQGLRDAELDRATGIEDCVFVHASGFIGGHLNREGALAMARKALQLEADS